MTKATIVKKIAAIARDIEHPSLDKRVAAVWNLKQLAKAIKSGK